MLVELRIDNFAIIPHLELAFSSGLITFSGETGAGKSIILDAIESILGGRVDATLLRAGAERASVEGVFRLSAVEQATLQPILEREELLDDPDYLTLGRELRREGRSTARVNGRAVHAGLLRELGACLVDIHGQSEHLSLLNVHQHLGLLDRYADSETLLSTYTTTYQKLQAVRRELAQVRQMEQEASHRVDLLSFQADEIEAAHLRPDEEEDLRQDRTRLANAENLASLAQESLLLLEEGSPESPPVTDLLGQVVQALAGISRIDAKRSAFHDQAESAMELLIEMERDLRNYLDQIEFNPKRLEEVEERLNLIHHLKRKYGSSIEAVLAYGVDACKQLDTIAHASERITELEAQESALLLALAKQGDDLSQKRRAAATALAKDIEGELGDLRMNGARFAVDFQTRPDPQGVPLLDGQKIAFDASGVDRVEFLVAPNPGEGLKPLIKIASGGETSRLMLALKNVLARADTIPTLIFDEIDQGIGGRVGLVIGEKLWRLGHYHQVLCVTHLPQLAAFGDQHYRVSKQVREGRTVTQVEKLNGESRRQELAQMMGGSSEGMLRSADEILQTVRKDTQLTVSQ
jgi:DNA repair protein RecN (Recombination protein N)